MKKILSAALACLAFAAVAAAQQTTPQNRSNKIAEAIRKIPLTGNKPEDFVPAGWEIHGGIARGDLNGDRLIDYALDITPNDTSGETEDFFYDAVIVLFGEKGRRLRRAGFNDKLSDNGFGSKQTASIEKGILITSNNYGNNYATDVTFKFRFDKQANDLLLIGFDYETYTRSGNEDGFISSYNFLTGVKEEITNYIDRRPNPKGVYDKQTKKRSRIERVKISFEKAQLSYTDENGWLPY